MDLSDPAGLAGGGGRRREDGPGTGNVVQIRDGDGGAADLAAPGSRRPSGRCGTCTLRPGTEKTNQHSVTGVSMKPAKGIFFSEISADPSEFLGELGDAQLHKGAPLPPAVSAALRRQQVLRLENNIGLLRKKQEDFNRKMEEYIQNLRALIGTLERSMTIEEREPAPAARPRGGTEVRCLTCGEQKLFRNLRVIAGRESEESLATPTQVIVEDAGRIKKGTFSCPCCGNGNLLIRQIGRAHV